MPDSADIAVQSSNYQGNAVLGGSGGEAFKFDMKPLEQLSAYVNLQNKTLWEQKQKNADKLVDQLASITNLDVNDLYGGDRDKMIDEMTEAKSKIANALRSVPSDPNEYAKWYANAQEEIGKISGKYATRKQRTIDRASQIGLIQEKYPNDPKAQAAAIKRLNDQFANTDGKLEKIPLWQPAALPKVPVATQSVDVYNTGKGNMDVKSSVEFFSPKTVSKAATQVSVLGFNQASQFPSKTVIDSTGKQVPNPAYAEWAKGKSKEEISFAEAQNLNTDTDETKRILAGGTDQFKSVISKYYDADGKFDEERFRKENSGNTVLIGNLDALQALSKYSKEHKASMTSGSYVGNGANYRLPKSVSADEFDAGIVDDYRTVTPEQLLMSDAYLRFAGDKVTNKEIMTNSADERAAQANSLKIARINESGANERSLNTIRAGQGWTVDAKGKWHQPTSNPLTSSGNDGVVPYWQNVLLPQINGNDRILTSPAKETGSLWWKKKIPESKLPSDYTGQALVNPDEISGLSVALFGEKTTNGEGAATDKTVGSGSEIYVNYVKGVPTGLVIDGVLYDSSDINRKATQMQNSSVSGSKKNTPDEKIFDNSKKNNITVPGL